MARLLVYVTSPMASSKDSGIFQPRYEREIIALDRGEHRNDTAALRLATRTRCCEAFHMELWGKPLHALTVPRGT
jgi:hypothetical protein